MNYIIQQIERHPDRCTLDMYGPYPTWDEANDIATGLFNHPRNLISPSRGFLFDYTVHALEAAPL